MLIWIVIISLLLVGLALVIIELIFIPGTTVVGLLGAAFLVFGVIVSYNHFGNQIGLYILLGTSVITGLTLFYSFRSNAWSKFSLKSSSKSKVNEGYNITLKSGDEGITVSALRPSGKAEFLEKVYEVRTTGAYLEPKQKVKIILANEHQIIVEPLS